MKKYISSALILTLLALILAACTGAAAPTQSNEVLMTSAVGSMVASFFGTQTAMYTPSTPTFTPTYTPFPSPTIIYPTATFAPTLTPTFIYYSPVPVGSITATGTLSTPTVDSNSLAVGCNNLAFVRDVTIPAWTIVAPGDYVTKTWKVENTGTCDWLYQYTLVLTGGEYYESKDVKIQKRVPVGSWTELSVSMTAPRDNGTYTNYWRLSEGPTLFGATLVATFTVQ